MASMTSALMAPAQVRPVLVANVKGRNVWRSGHACKGEQDTTRPLFVNSSQPAPAGLLTSGSQVFVDTDLPLNAGQYRGSSLRVVLNAFATSGTVEAPRLAPTTLWASYFEIYVGSQLIETVYNPIAHQETWEWAADQDRQNLIPLVSPGGYAAVDISGSPDPIGYGWTANPAGQVVFIPLKNCLDSIRPYCRGISETLRIRTYFNGNSVFPAYDAANNTVAPITVGEIKLVMLEAILSEDADRALAHAYNATIDLPCVIRERFTDTITLSAGNDTNTVLRSLKNKSAGIVYFLQDTGAVQSSPTQSQNLAYYLAQMLDARNNKLSERLDENYINSSVIPHNIYTAWNSEQATAGNVLYGHAGLFPFAKAFQRTVATGCFSGQFQFSSLETLVINPGTSVPGAMTNTKSLSVFSFSYGHFVVSGRKASFRYA